LSALILAMTTVFVGSRVHHVAHMRPEPEARARELAAGLEDASARAGVPLGLLVALAWSESGFNSRLVGQVGEVSFMQLHPAGCGRHYPRHCRGVSSAPCDALAAYLGAVALRLAWERCGTWGMAVGAYKSGRCIEGPRARQVLRVWAWLELELL
jgi:soluble lytic murein transglycosylase-like protein